MCRVVTNKRGRPRMEKKNPKDLDWRLRQWLRCSLPTAVALIVAAPLSLHGRNEPVTRGAPGSAGMPNPASVEQRQNADRDLTEYVAALEQQNEILCGKLHALENASSDLTGQIRDREARLVKLSQTLGEKEQLVATILANEDVLTDALAMRDERLSMLEETLNNLKARAAMAAEFEQQFHQLSASNEELQEQLQQLETRLVTTRSTQTNVERELMGERQEHQSLASAYEQLQLQRDGLDAALQEANSSLQSMHAQIAQLQTEHGKLAALEQAQVFERRRLEEAQGVIASLEGQLKHLNEQFSAVSQRHDREQVQWSAVEAAHVELGQAYQRLAYVNQALEQELSLLVERLDSTESELSEVAQNRQSLARQHEEVLEQLQAKTQAVQTAQTSLALLTQEKSATEQHLKETMGNLTALQAAHEAAHVQAAAEQQELRQLQAQLQDWSIAHAREQVQMELQEAARNELSQAYQALAEHYTTLQQDLVAATDIEQELHTQLAAKMRECQSQQKALSDLSAVHQALTQKSEESDSAVQALQQQLTQVTAALQVQLQESEQQGIDHQRLKDTLIQLTASHDQLQEALCASNLQCVDLNRQLALTRESVNQEKMEAERQGVAYQELLVTCQQLSETIREKEGVLAAATSQLAELESRREAEHQAWDLQEKAHHELVQAYTELATCHRDVETAISTLNTERLNLLEQIAQLQRNRTLDHTQWELQERAHAELVQAYQEVTSRMCLQECELAETRQDFERASCELAAIKNEYETSQRELQQQGDALASLYQQCQGLALTNRSLDDQLGELVRLSREKDSSLVAARGDKADLQRQLEELSRSWQQMDMEKQTLVAKVVSLEKFPDQLKHAETRLQEQADRISQLTSTVTDQQTAMTSLERTRDSLAKELTDLKAFQGALLQWEVEKLASARASQPQSAPVANSSGRPPVTTTRIHIVSPGETLSNIAQQYNKSIQDLYNANCDSIPNQNQVRIGTALVIP